MITFVTDWPGVEEIKSKIDNAKYFNFIKFPIPGVDEFTAIKDIGILPWVNGDKWMFDWESTIAYWMNRVHEYHQSPYELRDSPLLEDLVNMCYGKETRMLKQEYDQWNPIYQCIKEKQT